VLRELLKGTASIFHFLAKRVGPLRAFQRLFSHDRIGYGEALVRHWFRRHGAKYWTHLSVLWCNFAHNPEKKSPHLGRSLLGFEPRTFRTQCELAKRAATTCSRICIVALSILAQEGIFCIE
jgi:hypothetical protein